MKARVIKFPNRCLPATRQPEPAIVLILPVIRVERVECRKVTELRRRSRQLRERFNSGEGRRG